MPIIELDFETKSKIDITACGAGKYASDPSTDILMTCWAVDDGPIVGQLGREIPHAFFEYVRKGYTFSGFNSIFEQLIWTYRWPQLKLPKFICTRALAGAHGLPQNLDACCKALNIGWTKDIEGKRLINKYSKPREDGTFNELKGEDAQKFLKYCAKDVLLSRRIRQRLPALSATEQRYYEWTVKANMRGVPIDVDLAEKAENISRCLEQRGNKELSALTDRRIFSVSQIQRIKNYLKEEFGIETESLDKEAIEELLLQDAIPIQARKILEIRRDLSQASVKKFARAKAAVCADGRVRDALIYCGAGATGRWASQLVQFQNLPKYTVKDPETALRLIRLNDPDLFDFCYRSPMLALSSCVRGLIKPQTDELLAVVDYNAIEARCLMWEAGQEDVVSDFYRGVDPYIKMAETIYRETGFTKQNNPKERFLGKTVFLGAGYQLGFIKFQAYCDSNGIDLGEKTEYVERENKEGKKTRIYYAPLAKQAIDGYRSKHPAVVQFWWDMQRAAEHCVLSGEMTSCRAFTFIRERQFLYMILPSGRRLAYHRPGVDDDGLYYYGQDSQSHAYVRKRTYGGRLVENCLAKDTLVLTMRGCIPIIEVTKEDKVWDGEKWVATDGAVNRGIKETGWLDGIQVTPEHKIRVGSSWRRAIDMDENSWQDALNTGLGSESYLWSTGAQETTAQLSVNVRAAVKSVSARDPFSEDTRRAVQNAAGYEPAIPVRNTEGSSPMKFYPSGFIGIREWFHDAITRIVRHTRTTVGAVLKSMNLGLRIAWRFWSTPRLSQVGITQVWNWIDETIAWAITQETYVSWKEKRTAVIDELLGFYTTKGNQSRLWTFGRNIALFGKATMLLYGIFRKAEPPKKLWTFIGERQEVFDLLNCGPNRRFTIISSSGPVIVHNCTQAVARDILAYGIDGLEEQGFEVLLTVHDENVVSIKDKGQLEKISQIMCDLPAWAKKCPIAAEGFVCERYRKG